ncbi:MAG: hypothetical protein IPH62_19505 [Ignavibacteriae bacterium]|nr:hypothetical protein [Ignavibacteriota bacterium]
MNFTDRYDLTEKSMSALARIKENRKKAEDKVKLMSEIKRPIINSKIEEFSESAYIKKINIDENVYYSLLKVLNEEQLQVAKSIISKIEEDVKSIYELANIKPKIYGFQELDLDSSKEELNKESSRIINEHFEKQYYNLTSREKEKKYKDVVISMSHEFFIRK